VAVVRNAVDPGRRIDTRTRGAVLVMGDEERLRQVIANVVGNALVHTPEGTPIRIGAHTERDVGVVEITDEGPGMDADVAAHGRRGHRDGGIDDSDHRYRWRRRV
jgi:signal transduction histidine kinase